MLKIKDEIKVGEIWKTINDFKNYEVSNLGRIKSLPRPKTKGGILKSQINKLGYSKITLLKNGKQYLFSIHRLVAEAFISNPNNLPEVNHKDGNKQNNCVDNLEWVTHSENIKHRFITLKQEPFRKYNLNKFEWQTKEDINKYHRMYYKKNRNKILKYQRKWRNSNKRTV